MFERILICSIGAVEHGLLVFLAKRLSVDCGFTFEVGPPLEIPSDAYHVGRCQYNAKTILKGLTCGPRFGCQRVLGLTPVDLFVPILKYVYGLAQIEGPCAVVSTYRLDPCYYDAPSDQKIFYQRVHKTALHELGHTVGLTHCRSRRCVMYSSVRIDDTDAKDGAFCATCAELFRWKLKHPAGEGNANR